MKKVLIPWAIVFGVIGLGLYVFVGRVEPMVMAGFALAALLSQVLMMINNNSEWQGEIIDFRTRLEHNTEDTSLGENVLYASVRLSTGKTKRIRASRNWRLGDRLIKKRGQPDITYERG